MIKIHLQRLEASFSAASVGLTPNGYDRNLTKGPAFRPANNLPQNPSFHWSADMDPTNETAGGYIGTNVGNNRAFADKFSAAAGARDEINRWKNTFFGESSNINLWNSLSSIKENVNAFSKAIGIVANSPVSLLGLKNASIPSYNADLTNFVSMMEVFLISTLIIQEDP